MALLPDADRQAMYEKFMRAKENVRGATYTKADLRSGFDSSDAWADANATSYNASLPAPLRTGMTPKQKILMLAYTLLERARML